MGIRMKVAVGYGLDLTGLNTDLIEDFSNMEDETLFSAFVADALASAAERDDLTDKMAIGFALGTTNNPVDPDKVPKTFDKVTEYDPEFAFEDKLLLYPFGYQRQWSRYDDPLDAFVYEAYQKPGDFDLESEWREKPGTLYPFVNLMRANPDAPLGVESYWESCYLNRPEHRDAIPYAPFHLWHLIRHLKLTDNDADTTKAFLSLRPTLMRWWS